MDLVGYAAHEVDDVLLDGGLVLVTHGVLLEGSGRKRKEEEGRGRKRKEEEGEGKEEEGRGRR